MTRLSFETLEAVENMQLQIIEQQKTIEKMKADYNELVKKVEKISRSASK